MTNNWKIYYGNGETFSKNAEGMPPSRDVQVIVQENKQVGWHTQCGYDYYVLKDDNWIGVDIFGLFDYLIDSGIVLFGRTVTNAEFDEIFKHANEDREFAAKTGYLMKEHHYG